MASPHSNLKVAAHGCPHRCHPILRIGHRMLRARDGDRRHAPAKYVSGAWQSAASALVVLDTLYQVASQGKALLLYRELRTGRQRTAAAR